VRAEGDPVHLAGCEEDVFASWRWDGAALEVRSCRFGLQPLFYWAGHDEFAIADAIVPLLQSVDALDVDDDAMAAFLRIGFFLEGDTPFRQIRAVPPGAAWRLHRGGLVPAPHSDPPAVRTAVRARRVDEYAELFRQSLRRRPCAGEDVLLPLSGGRDSRHALFELVASGAARQARSFQCVTSEFPPTRSIEDLRVAQRVCGRLGLAHRRIAHEPSFVAASLRKNILTSFGSDEHTWAVPLGDAVNERRSTVYDGLGGDVLSAGLFSSPRRLRLLRAERAEDFVLDLFGHVEVELRHWLRPAALRRFSRERAVARAAAAVRRHCRQPNPVASFFFWNRTRREIALQGCCMYRPDTRLHYPYLDHALYDYLAGIPGEELDDKRFHTETIAVTYPQWAGIAYGRGDDDPEAARLPAPSRRRWNTRLAFEASAFLLRHRGGWVDETAVVPRLVKLVGAADTTGRFWMNIERILWAAQLDATLRRRGRGAVPAADEASASSV
jgi:asparagine synthetase B (glutamine-hydrolysing)